MEFARVLLLYEIIGETNFIFMEEQHTFLLNFAIQYCCNLKREMNTSLRENKKQRITSKKNEQQGNLEEIIM